MVGIFVNGQHYDLYCKGWFEDDISTWKRKLARDNVKWQSLWLFRVLNGRVDFFAGTVKCSSV